MGTSFLAFSGILSIIWQEKKTACSLNKLKPTCKNSGTFKLTKLTEKNLLGNFPLASSNVVYVKSGPKLTE